MRYSRYLIGLPVCLLRVMSLLVVVMLVSGSITSCAPVEDPSYRTVAEALKNEANDPAITARILRDNLDKVTDKNVIPFLLDYLKELKQRYTISTGVLGRIVSYLERVTGSGSRISMSIGGPAYLSKKEMGEDIDQWQAWWDTNKDYIYWDKQAQALKVKPH